MSLINIHIYLHKKHIRTNGTYWRLLHLSVFAFILLSLITNDKTYFLCIKKVERYSISNITHTLSKQNKRVGDWNCDLDDVIDQHCVDSNTLNTKPIMFFSNAMYWERFIGLLTDVCIESYTYVLRPEQREGLNTSHAHILGNVS